MADSLRLAVSSSGLGGGTPAHLDVRMLISKTIEGQSIFMKGRLLGPKSGAAARDRMHNAKHNDSESVTVLAGRRF